MESFRAKVSAIRDTLLTLPFIGDRRRLRTWALAACFVFGVFSAWIGMQFQGTPEAITPLAHARLLAAETFSNARLANTSRPGDFFLQTYQVLQSPSYSAAVSPGAPLIIAIGNRLNDPLIGLWLQSGLLSLSVAWMTLGFASLRWAVIGSLFTTIWFGTLSFWGQSFDGDAASAIGIALAWGAARRYATRPGPSTTAILAFAIGWTLLCDPHLALFAIPIPVWLWIKYHFRKKRRIEWIAFILPLLGFASFQACLNHAATGDALQSSTSLYNEKYNNHATFLWQKAKIPNEFDFVRMEQHDLRVEEAAARLAPPVIKTWSKRITSVIDFYAGPLVTLLLAGALWIGVTKWARWLLVGAGLACFGAIIVLPYTLSYSAALACMVPLLLVWALRRIWTQRERSHKGTWRLTWSLVAVLAASTYSRGLNLDIDPAVSKHAGYKKELTEHLKNSGPGQHVVMVRYALDVPPEVEYVYNTANPDKQDIIWARWNENVNAINFFERFKSRKTWLLLIQRDALPELKSFQWSTNVKTDSAPAVSPATP